MPALLDDLPDLGLAGHDFADPPEKFLDRLVHEFGLTRLDYWRLNRGTLSIETYRDLLASHGVQAYCINIDTSHGRFGSLETEQAVSGAMRTALAEALAFGASFVQVYSQRADGETRADRMETFVRQLTAAAEDCHQRGVMLVIENNFDAGNIDPGLEDFSRSPSDLKQVVEAVGPQRLALTYDPVNVVMTGYDPIESYDEIAPYVANIHIKDCAATATNDPAAGRRLLRDGDRRFARSVPVGAGEIDWRAFVAHVTGAGFSGCWTVDPFCDPDDVVGWTRRSLEFVRGESIAARVPSESLRKEQA